MEPSYRDGIAPHRMSSIRRDKPSAARLRHIEVQQRRQRMAEMEIAVRARARNGKSALSFRRSPSGVPVVPWALCPAAYHSPI